MQFTIKLEESDEGGYTAQCLEIPAAISEGDTKEDALENKPVPELPSVSGRKAIRSQRGFRWKIFWKIFETANHSQHFHWTSI